MKIAFCLCLTVLSILPFVSEIQAQSNPCNENTAQILILGTYHMNNPGQDQYNTKADDVLAPKRQREMNEIIEKLEKFKPTKIAIESAYRSKYWTSRYSSFLEGNYKLGRNEIEQIGFQLAKRMEHETVYPIDFPMWMNGLMPNEREQPKVKNTPKPKPTPDVKKKEQSKRTLPAYIQKKEDILRTGTILDVLKYLNSEEYMKPSHANYMDMLLPSKTIAIYGKTDLVTNWYKRNLRMFTNINRITDFPNDRILLIVGSGHLKILRDFAKDSSSYCLIDTLTYLK